MNTVEDLLPDHLKEGLSLAERKLLQCLPVGEIADLHAGEEAEDDPEQWSSWGPERTIRADLLAYLCSSQQVRALVHPKGLQVKGARIQGMLDVEGATISFGLSLQDGAIPDGLILGNARIGRLALDGSYLGPVTGDNMVIEGPMRLKQVRVRGQVQLETVRIEGNLDCTNGHFENWEDAAILADGASIKGGVLLGRGFQAKGQVHLRGANIGGHLGCRGGHFENSGGMPSPLNSLSSDKGYS
jgi:cytoskeletal protein CcmA (bactofilin family)